MLMKFVASVVEFPPVPNLHLMILVHCWSGSSVTKEQVLEIGLAMVALTLSHAPKSQIGLVMVGALCPHHHPTSCY
jgi:hypothetical protein